MLKLVSSSLKYAASFAGSVLDILVSRALLVERTTSQSGS